MYTQLDLENKIYKISKRNFLDDYSNYRSKKIDMTLSGKYLYKYPKVIIKYFNFSNYPTHHIIEELTNEIRKINLIQEKEIIIGNGANGIIQNIVKILFRHGGNLVTPFLTFNQPEYAVTAMGGYTKRVYMKETGAISIENIISSVDNNTNMVYICNPNNPTGMLINNNDIKRIANSVNSYVIIDESAIEFSEGHSLLREEIPDNVIIVKSLSKAYGIANLRVGYMICSSEFKKLYEKSITVNEVSGISCEYAKKIISCNNFKKNIEMIIKERKNIEKQLMNIGFEFYPSESNILFSKTALKEDICEEFCKNEISVMYVRDEHGKLHFRIAVQDKMTNKAFIRKCKNIFNKK